MILIASIRTFSLDPIVFLFFLLLIKWFQSYTLEPIIILTKLKHLEITSK
jgi:hypothetical protein